MPNQNRDAEIIAASTKFCAAETMRHALFKLVENDDARERKFKPLNRIAWDALEVLTDDDIRAVGMEAIRARATALTRELAEDRTLEGHGMELLKALLNDLVGAGACPWVPFPATEAEKESRAAHQREYSASPHFALAFGPDFEARLAAGEWPHLVGHEEDFRVNPNRYKPYDHLAACA